jgi:hypothetical protein
MTLSRNSHLITLLHLRHWVAVGACVTAIMQRWRSDGRDMYAGMASSEVLAWNQRWRCRSDNALHLQLQLSKLQSFHTWWPTKPILSLSFCRERAAWQSRHLRPRRYLRLSRAHWEWQLKQSEWVSEWVSESELATLPPSWAELHRGRREDHGSLQGRQHQFNLVYRTPV